MILNLLSKNDPGLSKLNYDTKVSTYCLGLEWYLT
jgi:hypothetical protein